jgi:predicted GIY-YIG superfamily endonuclease
VYTKKFRYYKLAVAEELRIQALTRAEKEKLVAEYIKTGENFGMMISIVRRGGSCVLPEN